MLSALVIALMSLNASNAPALGDNLAPPVRIEAAGKPIDTEVGHAAPFVYDWDGDGVKDLLVGQFGGGILTIYRNEGTDTQPKLAAGVRFQAGGKDGTVPSG
ncbi:MAG: hypothetical protein M1376_09315 [Planctomycetes bacterium]|nr:hypothetical protein [Planctomycetota bacterium]